MNFSRFLIADFESIESVRFKSIKLYKLSFYLKCNIDLMNLEHVEDISFRTKNRIALPSNSFLHEYLHCECQFKYLQAIHPSHKRNN